MTRGLAEAILLSFLIVLVAVWLRAQPVEGAEAQLKSPLSGTKIRLAVPSPSSS